MKNKILVIICLFPMLLAAQNWKSKPFSAQILNNATMLPPASLTATFNQPLHAGAALGYEFGWRETDKAKWFQSAKLGYFYHQFAYQAIQLYTEGGYRRSFNRLSVEGGLLMGYMHQFLLSRRAVLQSDGTYKADNGWGRPQFMAGADVGLGYNFGSKEKPQRLTLNYQFWVQTPFAKGYVPVLPNGSLLLGWQFCLP
ncbi:MAG: hypothetical protein JNL70_07565 [Saprospiraceae bacterium]|nr:hypothetical protein [Saprospiraceae bacterium]